MRVDRVPLPGDVPSRYRFVGATIVDPARQAAIVRPLVVNGDRLGGTTAEAVTDVPMDGLFILPGLIDMHVHLVPSLVGGRAIGDDALSAIQATMLESLRAGVTTLRDVGGPLDLLVAVREAQRSGALVGSRLFIGGPVLSVPGGHGLASGHGVAVSSPSDAIAVVNGLATVPVDHVKVITSGARGDRQLPSEVLQATVTASRDHGLPVAVHAHFQVEQLDAAVTAGATSIEHGFLLHQLPALLDTMASRGVWLCPTLRVIESIREKEGWYGQRLIPAAWEDARLSTAAAFRAGVGLITGTDFGVFGVKSGDVWREVELVSSCVDTRWAGLRGATTSAAEVLGRQDLGSVDEGALADLVVLGRDPVAHALSAADVLAVVQNGKLVSGRLPAPIPDSHD